LNVFLSYSTASNLGQAVTFNGPIQHGWDDDVILPAAVAYALHQAEIRRPVFATMQPDENIVAIMRDANSRHRPIEFLPPVLSSVASAELSARPSFIALQEWEGVVTSVGDEVFTARVVDLTRVSRTIDEEGEFPMSEVRDDDRSLVTPGAYFRWSVGITKMPGGGKRSTSEIIFRRLPKWTKRDIQRADANARRMIQAFERMNRSAD